MSTIEGLLEKGEKASKGSFIFATGGEESDTTKPDGYIQSKQTTLKTSKRRVEYEIPDWPGTGLDKLKAAIFLGDGTTSDRVLKELKVKATVSVGLSKKERSLSKNGFFTMKELMDDPDKIGTLVMKTIHSSWKSNSSLLISSVDPDYVGVFLILYYLT